MRFFALVTCVAGMAGCRCEPEGHVASSSISTLRFLEPSRSVSLAAPVRVAALHGDRLVAGTNTGDVLYVDLRQSQRRAAPIGARGLRSDAGPSGSTGNGEPAFDAGVSARDSASPTEVSHAGPIRTLMLSQDGARLLSVGGKTIILWQLGSIRQLEHLTGPQSLTAAVFTSDERGAFFSTDHGFVLRWTFGAQESEAVRGMACPVLSVERRRAHLPEAKRCPYGTFVENERGQRYCMYSVTAMARNTRFLARVCRTGDLTVMDLKTRALQHRTVGAVTAAMFIDDHRLVLVDKRGELSLYDARSRALRLVAQTGDRVVALAADTRHAALANGKKTMIVNLTRNAVVASQPRGATWLALADPRTLLRLDSEGTLEWIPLSVSDVSDNK